MGGDLPKQFLEVANLPILMHTITVFHAYDPRMQLIVVLPELQINIWKSLCKEFSFEVDHEIAVGGEVRYESVKNGLDKVDGAELIAIHDGVRPLVSHDTIRRCFECAAHYGTAIPVLPSSESIREGNFEESIPVDRSKYFLVQTPQVFSASILLNCYEQPYDPRFTDDASVVENKGTSIRLVEGNRENIKITFPQDLQIAELFLKTNSIQ